MAFNGKICCFAATAKWLCISDTMFKSRFTFTLYLSIWFIFSLEGDRQRFVMSLGKWGEKQQRNHLNKVSLKLFLESLSLIPKPGDFSENHHYLCFMYCHLLFEVQEINSVT